MKRYGFPTFLLLSLSLAAARAYPLDSAPQAQAEAYLAQARSWLAAGDAARAGSMALVALDLAPDYSEALFLSARIEAGDRPSTRAAIDHLRAALRSATWAGTDPVLAEQLLATLLLRTGQVSDAQKLALQLAGARTEDAQNFILLAQAYDKADNAAAELRVLAAAVPRFPRNEDLRIADARLLQRLGRSAEAAAIVRTGLDLNPGSGPLLLASAGLEIDRTQKIATVDLYLSKGGTDPLGALLGMEAAALGKRGKYLDAFLSLGGLSRQDLVGRAVEAARGSSGLASRLRKALDGYTGNRDLDADGDGAWEDRWVFQGGKPVRWIHEPAQDGIAQYAADFADGVPATFASRDPAGNLITITYSRYPFIQKAELAGQGTGFLAPYTMQCAFLRAEPVPAGTAPRIAAKIVVPTTDQVLRGSYRLEEYAADAVTLVRRTDLEAGQKVYMEESTFGDGVLDHRVWYTRGQPVRGARSLSRDDTFQVTETWSNGKLASEAIDSNGDGIPDYRETYGASGTVKSWDYNKDGKDDARGFDAADGTHVRELSTRMNGIFDLRIVSRGTRIISVTRDGALVAAAPDAARGVTWIGQPAPAGAGPDTTQPDGMQTIAGKQYLVFRLAGVVYVEALQE
jgi:tetratricopeptide (TPR) repeat protein